MNRIETLKLFGRQLGPDYIIGTRVMCFYFSLKGKVHEYSGYESFTLNQFCYPDDTDIDDLIFDGFHPLSINIPMFRSKKTLTEHFGKGLAHACNLRNSLHLLSYHDQVKIHNKMKILYYEFNSVKEI
jgi:hypothetical protein